MIPTCLDCLWNGKCRSQKEYLEILTRIGWYADPLAVAPVFAAVCGLYHAENKTRRIERETVIVR